MTALDRYDPAVLGVSALNEPIERVDFARPQCGSGDVGRNPYTLLGCDGRSEVIIEREPSINFTGSVIERQSTSVGSSAPPERPE